MFTAPHFDHHHELSKLPVDRGIAQAKDIVGEERYREELSAEGFTNEAIAYRLGLSIGTVNTYWLRIKLKTGGVGRTDAVVHIYKKRHEHALKEEGVDWKGLAAILDMREISDVAAEKARAVELHTRIAMIEFAMDSIHSTAWATDEELRMHLITNGELGSHPTGVKWEDGLTIYEAFNTKDKAHPAVVAHVKALAGEPSEQRLSGEFADMVLKVVPFSGESEEVIGCVSILTGRPSATV